MANPVRLAIVENGEVTNVIIGEPGFLGGIPCADEVAIGWLYSGGQFSAPDGGEAPLPDPEPDRMPRPAITASGMFSVTDGMLTEVGSDAGLSMAFAIDTGTYWLFFMDPMPDMMYSVYAASSAGQINVTTRTVDYVELTVKDGGVLCDPAEFSVQIVRMR